MITNMFFLCTRTSFIIYLILNNKLKRGNLNRLEIFFQIPNNSFISTAAYYLILEDN